LRPRHSINFVIAANLEGFEKEKQQLDRGIPHHVSRRLRATDQSIIVQRPSLPAIY
jgi:hypothetical protein